MESDDRVRKRTVINAFTFVLGPLCHSQYITQKQCQCSFSSSSSFSKPLRLLVQRDQMGEGEGDKVEAAYYETEEEEEETDDDDEENFDGEVEKPEKWRNHYSSGHRILLVGEGDFSFSLCLARAFGSAHNLVATSLDSQEMIAKKYSNGIRNVRELEERGCIVLYDVDAKVMSQHFFLKTQRFDRIVYNFPHVGFLYREDSYCQIQLNKKLVKSFLANAKALMRKEGGEIHVSHKEGDPYDKWDLVKKAEKRGLVLQQAVPFFKHDYPGYDNKRAHGKLADAPFPLGDCTTYKFKLKISI